MIHISISPKVIGLMAAGGVLTSLAEYLFHYSLFDYIETGIKKLIGLFHKKAAS